MIYSLCSIGKCDIFERKKFDKINNNKLDSNNGDLCSEFIRKMYRGPVTGKWFDESRSQSDTEIGLLITVQDATKRSAKEPN